MTTYYAVSAPLGSGKTSATIAYAGRAARAGKKIIIAQPSIRLINQSIEKFRGEWPNVPVRALHSESVGNVAREVSDHTKASTNGEVLFLTHAGLVQCPYLNRREDWHLIIDEAPSVLYHTELTLPVNHNIVRPALSTEPYNIRYSRLLPGDSNLLNAIAKNKDRDGVYALFKELACALASCRWDMFVLTEQWERFQSSQITDGKLLIFGLADPAIFEGFASMTMMSANLDHTIAYQHLVQHGHSFAPHRNIMSRLKFRKHDNGDLLTIHYAVEDGNWSKRKRDTVVSVVDETFTVNDLLVAGTLDLFHDQDFVWLANKDIEGDNPFGGRGIRLPHSSHGLNCFQHIHNAAVLPALNPSPALYAFLDEVAHLNSDEVRRAVYHEQVYQAAGRISTRNSGDLTPKHVVVADRAAADALAALYPGATVVRLPLAELMPKTGKPGPKRKHETDAARKRAYRDRRKAELLRQLDQVNGVSSETNLPIDYKVNSSLSNAAFGGSLFSDIRQKHATVGLGGLTASTLIEFLRDLHTRTVAKSDAWLWAPADFEAKAGVKTGRGLDNIKAIYGVFLDNDGGDLSPREFAAMFPDLMMVIHNSSSSTPDRVKWRAIIPTSCALSIEVHREIMLQLRQALNRRGYYDTRQLVKRAENGLDGKCHGFDPSKYNAASMFYLPAQAAAGPEASFFWVFDGNQRHAIDPYQWIDKSIMNHRPEPEQKSAAASAEEAIQGKKDPRFARMLEAIQAEKQANYVANHHERVGAAVQRWRQHPKGTGNHEFFRLAATLVKTGMDHAEVRQTLYDEASHAHGSASCRDRRASISAMMKTLRPAG